jgi:hypothetical protein
MFLWCSVSIYAMVKVGNRAHEANQRAEEKINLLHQMNPWWRGNAMKQLPETRRHLVAQIKNWKTL